LFYITSSPFKRRKNYGRNERAARILPVLTSSPCFSTPQENINNGTGTKPTTLKTPQKIHKYTKYKFEK
jgi:hypothetical protein